MENIKNYRCPNCDATEESIEMDDSFHWNIDWGNRTVYMDRICHCTECQTEFSCDISAKMDTPIATNFEIQNQGGNALIFFYFRA